MEKINNAIFDFHGIIDEEGKLFKLSNDNIDGFEINNFLNRNIVEINLFDSNSFNNSTLENIVKNSRNDRSTKINTKLNLPSINFDLVELTFVPYGEHGDGLIFFGAKDVSIREKEIEFYKQRSEHFLFAAENAGIGLWFWDLKKNEIFSTPKCNELYELDPYEIFKLDHFFDVVHPDDRERVENELNRSHVEGTEYDIEYRVVYSDGNINWISAKGKTFFDSDNEAISMMGSVRNITDQKLASEELAAIYEKERRARNEAVRANKAKDFFLAVVSHELRSPLNTILGWTKILLNKDVDENTKQNALKTIERSAKSQSKLIEDLVDSARVTSGKLKLELRPMNLVSIVNNVFNAKKPEAISKDIDLTLNNKHDEVNVFGDAIRLQQVITNVVTNALKFTKEKGNISIELDTDDVNVYVKISDDGQGISEDDLPLIFDQFTQAKDSSGKSKLGLGLGLSIAKILVEKHEGQISVESEGLEKGATFTITLPIFVDKIEEIESNPKEQQSNVTSLKGLNIFIVEDDEDSRNVLELFIEQLGASVKSAECVKEAIEKLQATNTNDLDVIISDIAMPEEDGISFINRIRKGEIESVKNIPAIALSAFTAKENKEKALYSGFQIYHTKPFDPDLLIEEIKSLTK